MEGRRHIPGRVLTQPNGVDPLLIGNGLARGVQMVTPDIVTVIGKLHHRDTEKGILQGCTSPQVLDSADPSVIKGGKFITVDAESFGLIQGIETLNPFILTNPDLPEIGKPSPLRKGKRLTETDRPSLALFYVVY